MRRKRGCVAFAKGMMMGLCFFSIPQMILKVQLFAKAKELAKGKALIEIRYVVGLKHMQHPVASSFCLVLDSPHASQHALLAYLNTASDLYQGNVVVVAYTSRNTLQYFSSLHHRTMDALGISHPDTFTCCVCPPQPVGRRPHHHLRAVSRQVSFRGRTRTQGSERKVRAPPRPSASTASSILPCHSCP